MNKQGPNKISWTDFTWNPVTGCKHGCEYCYARKIAERFKGTDAWPNGFSPTLHVNRLEIPKKTKAGTKIFVCSMADLFGEWVPKGWINSVMEVVKDRPDLIFQFLTKNPKRLAEFNPWPENCWVGSSVFNAHSMFVALKTLTHVEAKVRFVSAEPIISYLGGHAFKGIVDWVIMGAMTGPGATKPESWWIKEIMEWIDKDATPVFMKSNLMPYWDEELRQEFPQR